MPYMSELERKAWENRDSCKDHKPEMAMKAALDDMAGEGLKNHKDPVIHAMVVLVHEGGKYHSFSFYQAGGLSDIGVEGALMRAIRINQDG